MGSYIFTEFQIDPTIHTPSKFVVTELAIQLPQIFDGKVRTEINKKTEKYM
jgi:hypothetical protein